MTVCNVTAQTTVSGLVSDGKESLAGANVFIIGDGLSRTVLVHDLPDGRGNAQGDLHGL